MTESITALLASTSAVPRACRSADVRRTSGSHSDQRANPHAWACRWTASWAKCSSGSSSARRRRTKSRVGSWPEKQPLPSCLTHCVLGSTSALLSLESTVGAVGERRCCGDQFAFPVTDL
jgi:hypothetical protein